MTEPAEVKPLIRESSTSESTNVKVVLDEMEAGTIIIPDYQRDSDQWDATTKSLLVESVINNLSIPAFFFEVGLDVNGVESSRALFASSLGFQKSRRDFGNRAFAHAEEGWRCQKQPWTKITLRRDGKTRSGRPGSLPTCSL